MPPRIATRTDGPTAWFEALPPVVKLYMCAVFFMTVAVSLGLTQPYYLALLWPNILQKFEIWRLITNFFFLGPFSLHWVMTLVFLHNYGVALEVGTFVGRTADFVWIFVFSAMVLTAFSFLSHIGVVPKLIPVFNCEPVIFTILYVWSRNFREQSVSIWGLVKMQAFYLPFGMMALIVLLGNNWLNPALGIFVGHLYYFFSTIWPRAGGRNFLGTPQWLKNAVARSGVGTVNPAEVTASTGAAARAFQGQGRRLAD